MDQADKIAMQWREDREREFAEWLLSLPSYAVPDNLTGKREELKRIAALNDS